MVIISAVVIINKAMIQNITDRSRESTVLIDVNIDIGLLRLVVSAKDLHILTVKSQTKSLIITGINTVTIAIITNTPTPDLSTPTLP